MVAVKALSQFSGLLQRHLIEVDLRGGDVLRFEVLDCGLLNHTDAALMLLMVLVDHEPGGDGARVGVHVQEEQRPAHGQDLDDDEWAQAPEIVVQPNELVPVIVGQLLAGLAAELSECVEVCAQAFEGLLTDIHEYLAIHSTLVQQAVPVPHTDGLDVLHAHVPVANGRTIQAVPGQSTITPQHFEYKYLMILKLSSPGPVCPPATPYNLAIRRNTLEPYLLQQSSTISSMLQDNPHQSLYLCLHKQVSSALDNYHANLHDCFSHRQQALISELQLKAQQLKSQVAELRRLTSEEVLEGLVMAKKQEKEAERLKLEMAWRELTERLKKLEEEEKKLVNQNADCLFDIASLQGKIQELQAENWELERNNRRMEQARKKTCMLGQPVRKPYISPYKAPASELNLREVSKRSSSMSNNMDKKLSELRELQKIPNDFLMQLLSRDDVKSKIYQFVS